MISARLRKALLTLHVGTSVGWLGAIVAYIALNVPALGADREEEVRGAYLMMDVLAWKVLLPLAVLATLTGVVQALVTPWGLWKHYWVVVSLVATVVATVVLVLHLPAVDALAREAADPRTDVTALGGDLVHPVGGLVVLLVPLVLNIYKPRGLTPYGWRAQRRAARPSEEQQI